MLLFFVVGILSFSVLAQEQQEQNEQKVVFTDEGTNQHLTVCWDESVLKGDPDFALFIDEFKKEAEVAVREGKACGHVMLKARISTKGNIKGVAVTTGKTQYNSFSSFTRPLPVGSGEEKANSLKALIIEILRSLPCSSSSQP